MSDKGAVQVFRTKQFAYGFAKSYDVYVWVYTPTRNAYLRKMLLLVALMILVTTLFYTLIFFVGALQSLFKSYGRTLAVLMFTMLVMSCFTMMCVPKIRRRPWSLIFLAESVLFWCIIGSFLIGAYETIVVLYAALSFFAVVMVLLALSCMKYNFASVLLYLVPLPIAMATLTLSVHLGLLAINIWEMADPEHLAFVVLYIFLLSIAFPFELQLLIGGNSIEIGLDEEQLAAFVLFNAVIAIFIDLMRIFFICCLSTVEKQLKMRTDMRKEMKKDKQEAELFE